jgi:hypothetical protein
MKRKLKRILALTLSLLMLIPAFSSQVLASPATRGTCGKNLSWKFSDGTLTISGKGAMSNFDIDETPWGALEVKKVVIKEGVTSLGRCAFGWQEDVSSIKLPKSLKKIGVDALTGTSLKSVTVAKGSKHFSTKGGVLFNKKKTVLYYYPSKKKGYSYTVPSRVKTIATAAFSGDEGLCGQNPYLEKLILPKKLKKVEAGAFDGSNVETFKFLGANPKFAKGAFGEECVTIRYPKKHKKCWRSAIKALKKEYVDEDGSPLLKFNWF